jgi:hypothetical protein
LIRNPPIVSDRQPAFVTNEIQQSLISSAERAELEKKTRLYVNRLEELADHWDLINRKKYSHREKNYDLHNSSIDLIPRTARKGNLLSLQTLLSSCLVPYEIAQFDNTKVYKAGLEYFFHAANLQRSFLAVTNLIKN